MICDQDIHGRHLKTHELSLKEKEFVKVTPNKCVQYVKVTPNRSRTDDMMDVSDVRWPGSKIMWRGRQPCSFQCQNHMEG